MSENTPGYYTPTPLTRSLPTMVSAEVAKFPPHKYQQFEEEFRRKAKSKGAAYALWLLLGWHYAYLGKWGVQFLYWISLAGLGIWAVVDLFRISAMVNDFNKDAALEVLRNMKAVSG